MKRIITLFFLSLLLNAHTGNLFAAVDLKVSANPNPVLPSERVAYELTVTNTGDSPVTGVVVQDQFSGSVTVNYLHIADGGVCPGSSCQTGERISWTLGTLAAHTSQTVRYEAVVKSTTTAGTVVSNLTELFTDAGDASVLTSVDVVGAPGLELSISEGRDPVVPGEQLSYTVVFGNRSSNVLGVKLRAPLPAGTSFVSASPGGGVVNGGIEWDLGTVLANAVGERRFTVAVDALAVAGDAVMAEAQLVNTTTSQTLVRAREVTALAAATPVELQVTANPDPVLANARVAYELTVTNTGDLPVTGVVVQDLFPESVTVNYLHTPDGGVCPGSSCQAGERISWTLGTLAAHTSQTVRYEALVKSSTDAGTVLDNLATVVTDVGRASARTAVVVGDAAGLELSISEGRDPVVPGEQLSYTVVFGNRSSNVLGVKLRAPLPAGTSFVSASPGGGVVNGGVEWGLGTVLANAVGERRFTVAVDALAVAGDAVMAEAQLVNTTTSQTLVRAREVTALAAATPVELQVTANPDPVLANERVAYELTVTNTGDLPVTGVVVQDLFPESVTVNYLHTPDGGVCPGSSCQTGERISWTLGTLAAHTSQTVRYEALVKSSTDAGTVLDNLATVVTDVGRASARTAVVVGDAAGLELSISEGRDPVVPGEQLSYTVVFGNRSSNVLGVKLRAPLPAGTSFVSASPGGGVVNGGVEWGLGTVLANAVGERRFTVAVDALAVAGDAVMAEAQLVNTTTSQTLVRAREVTALAAATPVELQVTANPDPVLANERVAYELTVTNTGDLPVTGVVVQDLFPESVTVNYLHTPDGGVCPGSSCQAGERISWTLGTLAAHTSQTVRYEALVKSSTDAGTVLDNLATVVTDVGRASARTAVVVGDAPGLELSISEGRDPVVPGEQLSYTVVFGNRTGSVADDLILEVSVPEGTTFVSATAVGELVNGIVIWELGDRLIPGGVDRRHFTVEVSGNEMPGGTIQADARLVDAATSQTLVRAGTITELVAANPAVRLTSLGSDDLVIEGAINYTLTVSNASGQQATGVVVKDLFPESVSVNYLNILDGGVCPGTSCQTGERITWTVGTLPAQSSQTLRFQVTKNNNLDDGSVLRNFASVVYDLGAGSSNLDLGVGIVIDSDEDGLPDSWELQFFGNLNQSTAGDFDNDDLSNLDEYWLNTDAADSDTDNDGMPDGFEVNFNLNPLNAVDANQDADGDGLTNLNEYQIGTNPRSRDSDADGMPDNYEVSKGFDPVNSADASTDADGDGFSNLAEFRAGTDPLDPNSKPKPRSMPWLPLLLE